MCGEELEVTLFPFWDPVNGPQPNGELILHVLREMRDGCLVDAQLTASAGAEVEVMSDDQV